MSAVASRDWATLAVAIEDGVCTLMMNRPEKFNAMSRTMRLELGDCLEAIARDNDIRAVILTGAGKAFSGGGDITDFQAGSEDMHALMGQISHRWYKAFWNLPQPVVGAINGIAAGGGCNLALSCDIIIASEEAAFAQTFHKIGLIPDLGGLFTLPRLVGLAVAKELALLGDRIPAARAVELGLVNRMVPAAELMNEAKAVARRLADGPATATRLAKRILNRSFESSMEQVLDQELAAQSFLFGTEDNRAGVQKFLDKTN